MPPGKLSPESKKLSACPFHLGWQSEASEHCSPEDRKLKSHRWAMNALMLPLTAGDV